MRSVIALLCICCNLLAQYSLFIYPQATAGFVTLLNTNTAFQSATATTTHSFTVNAGGTNVVAFAVVAFGQGGSMSVSSITFNGLTMTSCGAAVNNGIGGFDYTQIFYLVNPPTGSNSLAVTIAGAGFANTLMNLVVFQGVNQTTPVRPGTYITTSGSGASSGSLTITSDTHDRTLSSVVTDKMTITSTNQTLDGGVAGGTTTNWEHDHCTTPAASVTHTWHWGSSGGGADIFAIAGFSIQPA